MAHLEQGLMMTNLAKLMYAYGVHFPVVNQTNHYSKHSARILDHLGAYHQQSI